ncbi:hypothetical protein J19TS2_42290 [Cohnella xylanilytica]|nr:hypothetical protein J19TS2_42290 [Cohnella xylanilytica]
MLHDVPLADDGGGDLVRDGGGLRPDLFGMRNHADGLQIFDRIRAAEPDNECGKIGIVHEFFKGRIRTNSVKRFHSKANLLFPLFYRETVRLTNCKSPRLRIGGRQGRMFAYNYPTAYAGSGARSAFSWPADGFPDSVGDASAANP